MEITSVEKHKKNNDRLSVHIDGKYAFSISEDDYLSMHLYENKVLSADEIAYIRNTLNFRAAKSTAVRYLSLKLRTEKEVKLKLQNEGFDHDAITLTIDELKAIGYINNKLYAQKYVYDRSKLKPKSKKLLKMELQSKGISEEDIDMVLDDWKVDESEVAEGLVKKKFGKYDLNDEKVLMKAYMFLKHRGYSYETVKGVFKKINGDIEI